MDQVVERLKSSINNFKMLKLTGNIYLSSPEYFNQVGDDIEKVLSTYNRLIDKIYKNIEECEIECNRCDFKNFGICEKNCVYFKTSKILSNILADITIEENMNHIPTID